MNTDEQTAKAAEILANMLKVQTLSEFGSLLDEFSKKKIVT